MRIINETPFSTKLIKRIMRLACVKPEKGKTVRITQDKRYKTRAGYFIGDDSGYTVRLKDLGDTLTLAHELRHLAQHQRGLLDEWSEKEYEKDAELFEVWIEKNQLF